MNISKTRYWVIYSFAVIGMNQILSEEVTPLQQCILDKIDVTSDATTLGELKKSCRKKILSKFKKCLFVFFVCKNSVHTKNVKCKKNKKKK